MPTLADPIQQNPFVKVLYIGDSGAGKTGSLVSLVAAGYKLRILDFDAGIRTLASYVQQQCPDKAANVQYESPRDKYKSSPSGTVLDGPPKAFSDGMKWLDKWPQDGSSPGDWGAETILVVDSLTTMSAAAFNWAEAMNPGAKDKRQVYYAGQDLISKFLYNITSDSFKTNVILIGHIQYNEDNTHGAVSSLGKALSPKVPVLFNNLIAAQTRGFGDNVRRTIRTVSTGVVDLKTEAPFKVGKELPLETGMLELFNAIKETSK